MKRIKVFVLLILACFIIFSGCTTDAAFSSNDNKMSKTIEKKLKKARGLVKEEKYVEAKELYTEVLKEYNSNDIRVEREYCDKYQMYITNRAYLWVEKGYLTEEEIKEFGIKIDKGIEDVEKYLKKDSIDNINYQGYEKLHYMVNSKSDISNTYTGASSIQLSWVKEKFSPYIHETVHIIAGPSIYKWLFEGLAVFIDDLYNSWGVYPYYQYNGEDVVRDYIVWSEEGLDKTRIFKDYFSDLNPEKLKELQESITKALNEVGTPHIHFYDNRSYERDIYYSFAGSFMKYLAENLGIENVMKIYSSDEPVVTVKEVSNKSLDAWKEEWITYLSTIN